MNFPLRLLSGNPANVPEVKSAGGGERMNQTVSKLSCESCIPIKLALGTIAPPQYRQCMTVSSGLLTGPLK
jgi:hypothetical protein